MTFVLAGAGVFLLGGIVCSFIPPSRKSAVTAVFAAAAQPFLLVPAVRVIAGAASETLVLPLGFPFGPAPLRLDPLAAFFVLLISLGGLGAAVYGIGYMKEIRKRAPSPSGFEFFFGILLAAMLLVVTAQQALFFLVAWEIMSLASFFLVGFEHDKEEVRKAAVDYLAAMQFGAAGLLAAFIWASTRSGDMDFASFGKAFAGGGPAPAAIFLLFFAGFGLKAGFVPFHTWLPQAHPAAPTNVSALMSGVMIKTGIYGILRVILLGGGREPALGYVVLAVGLATGVFGIMNAAAQRDMKKMLAYSSVENIGIIGVGLGLGLIGLAVRRDAMALLGFLGTLLHILNHFAFKSLLFYAAGIVYIKTRTRNIERLGGLVRDLPSAAALFFIGSAAICGLPLFNGFIGEFALFSGFAKGLLTGGAASRLAALGGLAGLGFIGAVAVLSFTKVFGIVFLGTPRLPRPEKIAGGPVSLFAPPFVLAGLVVFLGLFAPAVLPFFRRIVRPFILGGAEREWAEVLALYRSVGLALAVLAGLILFFIGLRRLILRRKSVASFKTWDCGYRKENPRGQYTGGSFAAPFLQMAAPAVKSSETRNGPEGLFPDRGFADVRFSDAVETGLILPLGKTVRKVLGLFTWIQTGRTQSYILYGLVFLIALIVWIIGVG